MLQLGEALFNKLMRLMGANQFLYNSSPKNEKEFDNSIYAAHPYTNGSLNPSYLVQGNRQHTIEGFRKTFDYNSVKEYFQNVEKQTKKYFVSVGAQPMVLNY